MSAQDPKAPVRAALAAVVRDLQAHLRWRGGSGWGRVPPLDAARFQAQLEAIQASLPLPDSDLEPAPASAPEPRGEAAAPPALVEAPASPAAAPAAPAPSPRRGAPGLEDARAWLGDCQRCALHQGRHQLVFGVGDPSARLVFVGEAPGAEEDRRGEPFVGAAGQLLDKMIGAMGLSRAQVYICNVVKCRPPNNRDPHPGEVEACAPVLKAQLEALQPEVIVALGRFAAQSLLGQPGASISKVRGRWAEYEGVALMPTFHPSYLLRDPSKKRAAWEDLQEVMARLGLAAPARRQ